MVGDYHNLNMGVFNMNLKTHGAKYVHQVADEDISEIIVIKMREMDYTDKAIRDFMDSKLSDVEEVLPEIGLRVCTQCGDLHAEGYFFEGDTTYYCSEECMLKEVTMDEYMELYELSEEGHDGAFYTQWFE